MAIQYKHRVYFRYYEEKQSQPIAFAFAGQSPNLKAWENNKLKQVPRGFSYIWFLMACAHKK